MVDRSRARQAAPPIFGLVLDAPPFLDDHVNKPGSIIAATCEDPTKAWRGYVLLESDLEESGYVKRGEFADRAIIGRVTAATELPVDHRLIDYVNTITVELLNPNDRLDEVTESQMLTGRNRFYIGTELLGCAVPTLLSVHEFTGLPTYQLSVLQRGMKGTFLNPMAHLPGETVLAVDGGGVYFYDYAVSRIGEATYFKFVANGGVVALASPLGVTLGGATCRPFAPVEIEGTRDGSNNLTITWQRHGRRSIQAYDQEVPIDEEQERYRIFILENPGDASALRQIDVVGARTHTYTAANHLTDGLTPGDPVTIYMYQMGTIVTEGFGTTVTL